MSYKRADIIPLIGGMSIGGEQAFGKRPDHLISWKPFAANDSHIVNHYGDVPYHVLDDGGKLPRGKIDVVSSTCPCAGLSMMSGSASADNPANEWMYTAAGYVLGTVRPEVYWGENAPQLAGKIGAPVRERLRLIGLENGYSMSLYTTKSLLHGTPQVRARCFYFFWRGDRVPLLHYFDKEYTRIEDVILNAKGNSQTDPINPKTPSTDDAYYRYILEEMHGGIGHREFVEKVLDKETARNSTLSYIQRKTDGDWKSVKKWLAREAKTREGRAKLLYERDMAKCDHRIKKLDMGKGFMMWGTSWAKGYIGAFVSHLPHSLTHPIQDRYITYREAMTIMGLPRDFELLNPKRSVNHICQNVPVQTARDLASEVKAYLDGKRETVNHRYVIQRNAERRHETPGAVVETGSLQEHFAA